MDNKKQIDDIFGDSEDDDDLNDLEVKDVVFDSDEEQELPSFKKDTREKTKKRRKREEGGLILLIKEVICTYSETEREKPVNEAQRDIDNILNKMKQRPKKLADLQTEVQADEIIDALLTSMRDAAYNDQELNKNGQPAIAKLKLLQSTMIQLSKAHWFQALLDQNVLECIKFWLEPLTDGSLPSLDIQLNMMNLLKKMPIDTHHLRSSKVGRVIMFYTKCDRVAPQVKKLADELLRTWMRPILGKSNNHKHRKIAEVRYQPRQSTSHASYRREVDPNAHENRASLPVKLAADFTVAPVTNLSDKGGSEKRVDRFKKLKSTLRMKKK
ncbi:Transcription factor iws1 [Terramyces sp. JEL0728]|nr:Transcription factor iws1 [Terramyces sp. JEL0728]